MSRETPTARLVEAAYAAGWAAVRGMPERLARRQFDAIADAIWMRHGKGVQRLESNLRRVLGPGVSDRDLRRMTHLGVRSYLRYWCEVFQLPRMPLATVQARFRTIDEHRMRDAVARGRGTVLVLPHMGNWDVAGAWLAGGGVPFTTVAERLEPASLFERFVAFRESLGMEVIPLTGGERSPFELLAERLRAGGTLCLLGDRDLTATGVEVDFFGSAARMPAGPAALARETGATLIPVTLWFDGDRGWAVRFHDEVPLASSDDRAADIRAMTQALADAFEDGIREHPQDWHMLQRVWVADLDPDRLPAMAGGAVDG
ncbi:MAG TPA: phosphatidylinositol mannoside acyltransferase [Mycobacteriales bacterium]|nr:phosphatidylinositol mannoside acyltransferase [Mycobacteriales bacterium]